MSCPTKKAAALVLGLGFALGCPVLGAAAATGTPSAADPARLPSPGVSAACAVPGVSGVCDLAGAAVSRIPDRAAAVTGLVAGAAEDALTHWLADSAAAILRDVLEVADATSRPDLSPRSFFAARLHTVAGLAAGIALLFLLFAVAQAVLRADPALLITAMFVRLPLAFGISGALLFMTSAALAVVDQATTAVIGGDTHATATQFVRTLGAAFAASDFGSTGLALVAVCALLTIVVGILLYAELTVRAAVIYLALLFMPLALAASVWSGAGRVARRLADILVTAVLTKFVILVALWLAAGLLEQTSAGGATGLGSFVFGIVILVVAAGSPLVLLGLVAHAEQGVAAIAGTRRAAYAPSRRAASTVRSATAAGSASGRAPGGLAIVHGAVRRTEGGGGGAQWSATSGGHRGSRPQS